MTTSELTQANILVLDDDPVSLAVITTVLGSLGFKKVLALEVLGPYHNEVHSALGRTPAAAWTEGVASAPPRLPRDRNAFVLDFLPWEERVVRSVANLTRRDAVDFLALAPTVPVRCAVETFPLADADAALARLRDGRLNGAAVLVP